DAAAERAVEGGGPAQVAVRGGHVLGQPVERGAALIEGCHRERRYASSRATRSPWARAAAVASGYGRADVRTRAGGSRGGRYGGARGAGGGRRARRVRPARRTTAARRRHHP